MVTASPCSSASAMAGYNLLYAEVELPTKPLRSEVFPTNRHPAVCSSVLPVWIKMYSKPGTSLTHSIPLCISLYFSLYLLWKPPSVRSVIC